MKTRKEIKLPSGGVVMLRPPSMLDLMQVGEPPASLQRRARTGDIREPLSGTELAWHVRSSRAVLLHCTGRIRWTNPDRTARLVEKPFDECRDDEMTVEDLSDADARAILDAVGALRQETAEAVQTFPAKEPPDVEHAGRNGEALPAASEQPVAALGS